MRRIRMAKRKNVTWRVGEHPEHAKINRWLDKQKNIQDSMANVVLHMIDQYGYVNITDYQVQKQLYGKITEIKQPIEEEQQIEKQEKSPEKSKDIKEDKEETSEDDVFRGVDPDNL